MSWGTRRRNTVVILFILIVGGVLSYLVFSVWYEPPTCNDGVRNGTETGVDCGGRCELICNDSVLDPIVLWTRYFTVAPGIYNAVAYIENPNPGAGIESIGYTFGLYNSGNALIAERKGSVRLPANATFPITENTLQTGQSRPSRISFSFDEDFVWKRSVPVQPLIQVRNEVLSRPDADPRVMAELENTSILTISDITVAVILYDQEDNAVRSSTTYIETLERGQRETVVFTWPEPFDTEITKIEVVPLYEIPE